MSTCPLITSLELDLTHARSDIMSPLSAVSTVSNASNAANRWKSSTDAASRTQKSNDSYETERRRSTAGPTRSDQGESSSRPRSYSRGYEADDGIPRRGLVSIEDLLSPTMEREYSLPTRLSKSMTDLRCKPSDRSSYESPQGKRAAPRRDYMPVEVLALQTMDLEDEERTILCSRLSRSMTDLQLSPKSKAFDNLTMTSRSRRKLTLTKVDSSQYMMPALPIREDSFKLSKNQNAQFETPQCSNAKDYIDQLIMKSALSVKSPWQLKQTLSSHDMNLPALQARLAISEPRTKSNLFFDSVRPSKSDGYYSSKASKSPQAEGLSCGKLSKSMTDLSKSPVSFHAQRPRSNSSERMPMMPMRRGSVETGYNETALQTPMSSRKEAGEHFFGGLSRKNSFSAKSSLNQTGDKISLAQQRENVANFPHSKNSKNKASSWSGATGVSRSPLSRSLTDLSRSPSGLADMNRSHSSERMPMMPTRRGSVETGHNDGSFQTPMGTLKANAKSSTTENSYIDELIMKSALSVKSPWHLQQTLGLHDRVACNSEERDLFYDTSSVQSTTSRGYSTSDVSCSSGLTNVSKSMTDLMFSPPSSDNARTFSELSRSHSSERMPMMPSRRSSINDGAGNYQTSKAARSLSKVQTTYFSPEKNCIDKLIMKSALSVKSPRHLKHMLDSADRSTEELQAQAAISKPRAKSNMFFDTKRTKPSTSGESPQSATSLVSAASRWSCGTMSKSLTDLNSGTRPELIRSKSSERMSLMPKRRGSSDILLCK